MDITKTSFYPRLIDILTDISESHFVAIDLELSGVPTKQTGPNRRVGKPSLQERYLEVKEAAEKYVILQFGLTCVREDLDTGKYICKPYNIDLSPLIEVPGLDVERDFSFSSSAVDFLKRVGFDFSKPFNVGVPYLSRDESSEAREKHAHRQKKDAIADLQLKETDVESLALLQRVRDEINDWLAQKPDVAEDYILIAPVNANSVPDDQVVPELSRYEKRLVHQLVRAEYPKLVTISKRGFVQVVHFNAEREARIQAERKAELNERLGRQKGFRWIIEALLGNDISRLDLRLAATDPKTGDPVFADLDHYNALFHRAHGKLRKGPRVLVGHNCFLDFVYIYKTFIGALPDTVQEFSQAMHQRWPTIIDTKYLATHNCGDINPASSLEEIARQLAYEDLILDELHKKHDKYKDVEVFHEAGFDSFLTAQVAVRLSMKLEREGAYVDDIEDDGQGGVQLGNAGQGTGVVGTAVDKGKGLLSAAVKALNLNGNQAEDTYASKAGRPIPGAGGKKANSSLLSLSPQAESFVPSSFNDSWMRDGDPSVGTAPVAFNQSVSDNDNEESPGIEGGMPRFSQDFWRVYGNRFRVFGTEDGVCVLNGTD